MNIRAWELKKMIDKVEFAIHPDRYDMAGICFEVEPEVLRLIATDGNVLSFVEENVHNGDEKWGGLIQSRFVNLIKDLCKEKMERAASKRNVADRIMTLEFNFEKDILYVSDLGEDFEYSVLVKSFPNWRNVQPQEPEFKAYVNRFELVNTLKSFKLPDKGTKHREIVQAEFGKDRLTITNFVDVASVEASSKEDFTTYLNFGYLKKITKAHHQRKISQQVLEFGFSDSSLKPIVIGAIDHWSWLIWGKEICNETVEKRLEIYPSHIRCGI